MTEEDWLRDRITTRKGMCDHFGSCHLRGEGRHVRGCWALDAILGKA